jgi:UDP-2,3-diacylglucosamine pyrophosphatase LpxH
MISSFCGAYGDITIQKHAIHRTADGRRILVIHGHELDTVVQNVKWLAFLGDAGYQFLLTQSTNQFLPSSFRPRVLVS